MRKYDLRGSRLGWREAPYRDKLRPQCDAVAQIHSQHSNRCPADGCAADEKWTVPSEVELPLVAARVEEAHDPTRLRIYAGQIRSFSQVVIIAGESQVAWRITAFVLAGDDMLNMKSKERIVVFVDATVFATKPCSLPNQVSSCRVDHEASARRARAFA